MAECRIFTIMSVINRYRSDLCQSIQTNPAYQVFEDYSVLSSILAGPTINCALG